MIYNFSSKVKQTVKRQFGWIINMDVEILVVVTLMGLRIINIDVDEFVICN